MSRSQLEVAEVLHRYHQAYLTAYSASPDQRKVMANLMALRSAALGGHLWRCQRCGHEKITYNSCRNRHCPTCQASKQAEWLQAQCANLLQVPYYHMVFTLPHQLCPLAVQNKSLLYGKPAFGSPEQVLKYLARYAHLVAISNQRLLCLKEERVSFRYKDYHRGH